MANKITITGDASSAVTSIQQVRAQTDLLGKSLGINAQSVRAFAAEILRAEANERLMSRSAADLSQSQVNAAGAVGLSAAEIRKFGISAIGAESGIASLSGAIAKNTAINTVANQAATSGISALALKEQQIQRNIAAEAQYANATQQSLAALKSANQAAASGVSVLKAKEQEIQQTQRNIAAQTQYRNAVLQSASANTVANQSATAGISALAIKEQQLLRNITAERQAAAAASALEQAEVRTKVALGLSAAEMRNFGITAMGAQSSVSALSGAILKNVAANARANQAAASGISALKLQEQQIRANARTLSESQVKAAAAIGLSAAEMRRFSISTMGAQKGIASLSGSLAANAAANRQVNQAAASGISALALKEQQIQRNIAAHAQYAASLSSLIAGNHSLSSTLKAISAQSGVTAGAYTALTSATQQYVTATQQSIAATNAAISGFKRRARDSDQFKTAEQSRAAAASAAAKAQIAATQQTIGALQAKIPVVNAVARAEIEAAIATLKAQMTTQQAIANVMDRKVMSIERARTAYLRMAGDAQTAGAQMASSAESAGANTQRFFNDTVAGGPLASAAMIAFGQTLTDASFFAQSFSSGVIAIGNNLSQLVTIFTIGAAQAGNMAAFMKLLTASLQGPMGVLLAVQAAIGIFQAFVLQKRKSKEEADALAEAFNILSIRVADLGGEIDVIDFSRVIGQIEGISNLSSAIDTLGSSYTQADAQARLLARSQQKVVDRRYVPKSYIEALEEMANASDSSRVATQNLLDQFGKLGLSAGEVSTELERIAEEVLKPQQQEFRNAAFAAIAYGDALREAARQEQSIENIKALDKVTSEYAKMLGELDAIARRGVIWNIDESDIAIEKAEELKSFIDDAVSSVEEFEAQIELNEGAVASLSAENEALSDQMQRLSEDTEEGKNKYAELALSLFNNRNEIATLTEENEGLENQIIAVNNQIIDAKGLFDALGVSLDDTTKSTTKSKKELDTYIESITSLRDELGSAEISLDQYKQVLSALNGLTKDQIEQSGLSAAQIAVEAARIRELVEAAENAAALKDILIEVGIKFPDTNPEAELQRQLEQIERDANLKLRIDIAMGASENMAQLESNVSALQEKLKAALESEADTSGSIADQIFGQLTEARKQLVAAQFQQALNEIAADSAQQRRIELAILPPNTLPATQAIAELSIQLSAARAALSAAGADMSQDVVTALEQQIINFTNQITEAQFTESLQEQLQNVDSILASTTMSFGEKGSAIKSIYENLRNQLDSGLLPEDQASQVRSALEEIEGEFAVKALSIAEKAQVIGEQMASALNNVSSIFQAQGKAMNAEQQKIADDRQQQIDDIVNGAKALNRDLTDEERDRIEELRRGGQEEINAIHQQRKRKLELEKKFAIASVLINAAAAMINEIRDKGFFKALVPIAGIAAAAAASIITIKSQRLGSAPQIRTPSVGRGGAGGGAGGDGANRFFLRPAMSDASQASSSVPITTRATTPVPTAAMGVSPSAPSVNVTGSVHMRGADAVIMLENAKMVGERV